MCVGHYIVIAPDIIHFCDTLCLCRYQVKWRNLQFVMWDIGGQDSLRQAWSTYFSGTHFLILVVDSTDRERLAVTKEELYRMLGNEVCCGCNQSSMSPVHRHFILIFSFLLVPHSSLSFLILPSSHIILTTSFHSAKFCNFPYCALTLPGIFCSLPRFLGFFACFKNTNVDLPIELEALGRALCRMLGNKVW